MKDAEEILAIAKRLGAAIAAHPCCAAAKAAVQAVHGDAAALELEKEYDAAVRVLQEKSAAGQPLEPEDKRREAALREKVAAHDTLREYARTHADLQELMIAVHKVIDEEIGR